MKTRREFIKQGALFVPSIFIPRLIQAAPSIRNASAGAFNRAANSGGGGGGASSPFITAVNSLDGSFLAAITLGMKCTVVAGSVTITDLGRYKINSGDTSVVTINLYDNSCTLLASTTVNLGSTTINTFGYGSITPHTFVSGDVFWVQETSDGTDHWANNGSSLTITSDFTELGTSGGCGGSASGQSIGPVGFKYHL